MDGINNNIFFGFNYNDKAIKGQFDSLKKKIEKDTPFHCIILDKRGQRPAKDLWRDIQDEIKNCYACFFDLTAFRPNVVLELGFALAMKNNDEIFITFNERKKNRIKPPWVLSDIGHLNREPYKNLTTLEKYIRTQIQKFEFYKKITEFDKSCDSTAAANKYREFGLKILQTLRDEGDKNNEQIKSLMKGSNCQLGKITTLLKKAKLIKRKKGRNGRWSFNYSS